MSPLLANAPEVHNRLIYVPDNTMSPRHIRGEAVAIEIGLDQPSPRDMTMQEIAEAYRILTLNELVGS